MNYEVTVREALRMMRLGERIQVKQLTVVKSKNVEFVPAKRNKEPKQKRPAYFVMDGEKYVRLRSIAAVVRQLKIGSL